MHYVHVCVHVCEILHVINHVTEESEGLLLENNAILKPGKLTNIRTYNHQHAFLLFSSLCLNISGAIATKRSCEYIGNSLCTSCDLHYFSH